MFNVKYEIVVPSTFGETPADNEFVASCLAHVTSAMNDTFGGCTVVKANGCWNNDNGETIAEPVSVVYAYATESTFDAWEFMINLAEWVKLRMMQSCVLIAESPVARGLLV